MKTTATNLRANLYTLLDHVAETGEPLVVIRKGVNLRINREQAPSRLSGLKKRPTMLVGPDAIVDQGWTDAWSGDL